ncbi:MAG: DcrB-related protein [Myxococcota bacterium]
MSVSFREDPDFFEGDLVSAESLRPSGGMVFAARVMPNLPSLRLQMPSGWSDQSQLVGLGPQRPDGTQPNIVVVREPAGTSPTAEDFAENSLKELRASAAGYSLKKDLKKSFAGRSGILRFHELQDEGRTLSQVVFYFLAQGVPTAVVFTDTVSRADALRTLAESTLRSIQLG